MTRRMEFPPGIFFAVLALVVVGAFAPEVCGQSQEEAVNPDARIIQDFENRIAEYVKLHKAVEAKMPSLKTTASVEKIARHQHELAEKIRKARQGANLIGILTPEIKEEFRRLIAMTMRGQEAARIKTSLGHDEPVRFPLAINGDYPSAVPLQSTPPTLLLNLPKLPPELEYRIVGHDLILRDVNANLIIDFISEVI